MSFSKLLSHFTTLKSEQIGSTNYVLGAFKSDISGQSRTILIDVSHQSRTQANYLSSLNMMMGKWDCYNLVVYLNSATQTLSPSIKANIWCFVDANALPLTVNGYEIFPLINQDPEQVHYEGMLCFSPSHRACVTEYSI